MPAGTPFPIPTPNQDPFVTSPMQPPGDSIRPPVGRGGPGPAADPGLGLPILPLASDDREPVLPLRPLRLPSACLEQDLQRAQSL